MAQHYSGAPFNFTPVSSLINPIISRLDDRPFDHRPPIVLRGCWERRCRNAPKEKEGSEKRKNPTKTFEKYQANLLHLSPSFLASYISLTRPDPISSPTAKSLP